MDTEEHGPCPIPGRELRVAFILSSSIRIADPAPTLGAPAPKGGVLTSSLDSRRGVADRLDVMPIGIRKERAVVVGVIVRAQPGRAEIGAAMREPGRVEGAHRFARRRAQRDVESGRRRDHALRRQIFEADVERESLHRLLSGRAVADLAGQRRVRDEAERQERGVVEALRARNISAENQVILDAVSMTVEEGIILGKFLAQHKKRVDAVFTVTDMMAIGVQTGLKAAGIRIPEDIAVMGFSDWYLNQVMDPPISSVAQPGYEMGKGAIELFLEEIAAIKEDKAFEYQTRVLPTHLMIRQSTDKRV